MSWTQTHGGLGSSHLLEGTCLSAGPKARMHRQLRQHRARRGAVSNCSATLETEHGKCCATLHEELNTPFARNVLNILLREDELYVNKRSECEGIIGFGDAGSQRAQAANRADGGFRYWRALDLTCSGQQPACASPFCAAKIIYMAVIARRINTNAHRQPK